MDNLQLATTLVSPTGTGLLYTPYFQGGDKAVWNNGVGAGRSVVSLTRVQPKPTATFPGVERLEFRRAIFLTVNSVEYQAVVTLATSIPVPITSADRTAIHLHAALLARDPVFKTAVETGAIPT